MPALHWRTIKRHEHRQVFGLIGPITHDTAATLRDRLDRTIGAGTANGPAVDLLLDLHCCTNIDAHGLLALHVAQQTARTRGGDLHLIGVPPLIQRLINQHHLEHLIQPDPDSEPPADRAPVQALVPDARDGDARVARLGRVGG